MSNAKYCVLGLLGLVVGCAQAPGPDDSLAGAAAEEHSTAQTALPLATIQLSDSRRLEFHATGEGVMVAEFYSLKEAPVLTESDKQLSPLELYKKFAAPDAEVPKQLSLASQPASLSPQELDSDLEPNTTSNQVGGGSPASSASASEKVGRVAQALSEGDGCNPPQSNVVFSDCRHNWFGGYFAFAVPTWFLDSRVTAVHGSLDAKFTSQYGGGTFVNTFHVAQGEVSNLSWPKARVCKSFLGVTISCSDTKATRRLDVINASQTTFNVDVVFFN